MFTSVDMICKLNNYFFFFVTTPFDATFVPFDAVFGPFVRHEGGFQGKGVFLQASANQQIL